MKLNIFSGTVYVKVNKNSFTVRHIEKNNEMTFSATKPFTTNRLLVGEFMAAEALLKNAIEKTYKTTWLSPSPIVIIQPMIMTEGGLSEVEERTLREVAIGSGARQVVVWVGKELSNEEVLQKAKSV